MWKFYILAFFLFIGITVPTLYANGAEITDTPATLPTTLPSPSAPSVEYDAQCRADITDFLEEANRYGDRPLDDVVERVVERARHNPDNAEFIYYAARSAIRGWAAKDVPGDDLMRKAAAMGYLPAIREVGFSLCEMGQNPNEGFRMILPIAENGDSRALYLAGICYVEGWGTAQDFHKSIAYLQRALDAGYYGAAVNLAEMHFRLGDSELAEQYYELAAELGSTEAMRYLVDPSRCDLIKTDPQKVGRYLMRGRIWRDFQLSRMLGASILIGRAGFSPDDALAVSALRWAANQGDYRSQALMARARLQGLWGLAKQTERALRELKWLANGADPSGSAGFYLGQALCEGIEVPIERDQGMVLLRNSAAIGFKPAQDWLAKQLPVPVAPPLGNPTTRASRESAMRDLYEALLVTAITIDSDPMLQTAAKASRILMPPEQQALEDDDAFHDWFYLPTDAPSAETVVRILSRARQNDTQAMIEAYFLLPPSVTNSVTPDESDVWLKTAAERHDSLAMAQDGRAQLFAGNTTEGLDLMQRSRDSGEAWASLYLGIAFTTGEHGVQKDFEKGMACFKEAYARGLHMGLWYEAYNACFQAKWKELLPFLDTGVSEGNGRVMSLTAWLDLARFPTGPTRFGWNENVKYGVFVRGTLFDHDAVSALSAEMMGSELPSDPNLARLLIARDNRQQDTEGEAILAAALITGEFGIIRDPERGTAELTALTTLDPISPDPFVGLGKLLGRTQAQWKLGELLYEGKFVPKDTVRGEQLIRQAAEHFNPNAIKWIVSNTAPVPAQPK